MTTVSIQGAHGKLGSSIVASLLASDNFLYGGTIERNGSIPVCDVVVAVAGDSALAELLPKLTGQKLIIGSTGQLPLEAIIAYGKIHPVFIVPNFAFGMRAYYDIVRSIPIDILRKFTSQITDIHHIQKLDSPSGTAVKIQSLLQEHGSDALIHSKRIGDMLGTHSVILENSSERITLVHETLDRSAYAAGCLALIADIMQSCNGVWHK
jgi:dihydrodipicolinate reductase